MVAFLSASALASIFISYVLYRIVCRFLQSLEEAQTLTGHVDANFGHRIVEEHRRVARLLQERVGQLMLVET